MKATLPAESTFNAKPTKAPLYESYVLVAQRGAETREVITVRWYQSPRGTRSQCRLWIYCADGRSFGGYGSAGGYGYHKPSASFEAALNCAGITLDREVGGCGENAVEAAMHAIAEAAGYLNGHIVRVHA